MLLYCLGEVGLRPAEFWSMTWTEVDAACRGYEIRLARERELPRFIATAFLNANRKPHSKAIKPQEIMPLVTDPKAPKTELMSREEYYKLRQKFDKAQWQKQS